MRALYLVANARDTHPDPFPQGCFIFTIYDVRCIVCLFLVSLSVGFITSPFGINLFYVRSHNGNSISKSFQVDATVFYIFCHCMDYCCTRSKDWPCGCVKGVKDLLWI